MVKNEVKLRYLNIFCCRVGDDTTISPPKVKLEQFIMI